MYVVYILYSFAYSKIYIGQTANLIQRFASHNVLGKEWTKAYRPWVVIYCEFHPTRQKALVREKQFKSGKGREWIWHKINAELEKHGFISA